jgi:hypothetical protein
MTRILYSSENFPKRKKHHHYGRHPDGAAISSIHPRHRNYPQWSEMMDQYTISAKHPTSRIL